MTAQDENKKRREILRLRFHGYEQSKLKILKLLFQLCSGAKQEQIEASYLNGDPAYYFQIGRNAYVIHFEGTLMNQRSVDPEVQAVRLVRRRPMSTSNSAPQTAMR